MAMAGIWTPKWHEWAMQTVDPANNRPYGGIGELLLPFHPNMISVADSSLIQDCLARYKKYGAQQPSWVLWDFARRKGWESTQRWREEEKRGHR